MIRGQYWGGGDRCPRPGDPWETILTFFGETGPATTERLQPIQDGEVSFAGPVVRNLHCEPMDFSVVRAGEVLVVVEGATAVGQIIGGTGRLAEENHARYTEDALFSHGFIKQTWIVPQLYDRSDPTSPPVHLREAAPIEVSDAVRASLEFSDDWEVRLEVEAAAR